MAILETGVAIVQSTSAIASGLKALGLRFATKHITWDQANNVAQQFYVTLYSQMETAYGLHFDDTAMPNGRTLSLSIKSQFTSAMASWWGLGGPISAQIQTDLSNIENATNRPVSRMLWLWCIWVLMNLDAEAGEDTNRQHLEVTFQYIFIRGIERSGLGLSTAWYYVSPGVGSQVTPPSGGGGTGTGASGGGTGTGAAFNLSSLSKYAPAIILVVIIIIAIGYLLGAKGPAK